MNSVWDLANPQLRDLVVYEPGKPIEETARELGVAPAGIVKLASNENPLGPSPRALEAMRSALGQVHLYPDGGGFYLRAELADRLGLSRDQIILGNGSNELIEFLCHAFVQSGDEIITPQHAFIAYKIGATLFGARTVETPTPNFAPVLDAVLSAITSRTRLIFIANPNNPTGAFISEKDLDHFIDRVPANVVIVLDEAYYEFLDPAPDTLRHIRAGRNVIVLRTFSKIHGLAGLRIGYGMADPELIKVLAKTREPFNVNSLGQVGARAALADLEHQRKTKEVVDEGRTYLESEFARLALPFVRSPANFIMVNVGDGPAVFQKMLAQKVIVRPLRGYGLPDWVRISVGTMDENRKCIEALETILPKSR